MKTDNSTSKDAARKPYRYSTPVLMARGAALVGQGDDRMLSIAGVVYKIGASRAAIYNWMAQGTFPRPIKLGPRRVAWKNSDLNSWLVQREAA